MPTGNLLYRGRFAPSPTGPLHPGSLATAIGSWLDARCHDGHWLIRIEDTDTPRCAAEAAGDILRTLHAFGLHHDGEVIWQSRRHAAYQEALDRLARHRRTFPCACSRKDIELALGDIPRHHTPRYPGTCRNGLPAGKTARAVRFNTRGSVVEWHELGEGVKRVDVEQAHGDFVIHRADGLWAYQLAVVVDDLAQGITHVVRGADLKDVTAPQIALMNALKTQNQSIPAYRHLPLILNERGEKLSKQAGARPLNLSDPVGEMNGAWRVFGLDAIEAVNPGQWLEKALPVWSLWRSSART